VVPDMKVPGVLMSRKGSKEGSFNLRKLRGKNGYVIFYTEGCPVCDAEKSAAAEVVAQNPKAKVLMVDVDAIVEDNPVLADRLFMAFDLSSLPFIIGLDKKGRVQHRYMTLQRL